jgi:hypothetical protein
VMSVCVGGVVCVWVCGICVYVGVCWCGVCMGVCVCGVCVWVCVRSYLSENKVFANATILLRSFCLSACNIRMAENIFMKLVIAVLPTCVSTV